MLALSIIALLLVHSSSTASDADNQPPTLASIGNKTIAEGSLLSFSLSASDADGDALTYSVSGNPGGRLVFRSDSDGFTFTFEWTPGSDDAGSYQVTFTASDGNGGSDSGAGLNWQMLRSTRIRMATRGRGLNCRDRR